MHLCFTSQSSFIISSEKNEKLQDGFSDNQSFVRCKVIAQSIFPGKKMNKGGKKKELTQTENRNQNRGNKQNT